MTETERSVDLSALHTVSTAAMLPIFSHPIFTTSQLGKAKQAYLRYGVQSESFPSQLDLNSVTTASLFDPPSAFSLTLNLAGVQLALQALGIVKADSEVKDLMFQLNQSAGITQQNKQLEKKSAGGGGLHQGGVEGSAGTMPLSSRSAAVLGSQEQPSLRSPEKAATVVVPPGGGGAAAAVNNSARALSIAGSVAPSSNGQNPSSSSSKFRMSFPIFLELLTMSHPSPNAAASSPAGAAVVRLNQQQQSTQQLLSSPLPTMEEELRAVFHVLDEDGDGVISSSDFKTIVQMLGRTLSDSNRDVKTAMKWNDAQVMALLREADLDCDGQVTFEDFRRAILTA